MGSSYRDDRAAALARADALQRENARLRTQNHWLLAQLDPDDAPDLRARPLRRGLMVGAALFAGAVGCLAALLHDAAQRPVYAEVDSACPAPCVFTPPPEERSSLAALVRPETAPAPVHPAPVVLPHDEPAAVGLALVPLVQGCFHGPARRVDLLAAVDPGGHVRNAHVFESDRDARSLRAERRCVRHAFASVTLPTARAVYSSYSPEREIRLVVLPASSRAHRHHHAVR